MGGQEECLPGPFFRNPFHFVKNSTRPDDGHPVFRGAFSFSHSGLRRFLGNRFIREDANPDPAGPLDESGHRNSRRFNLAGSQPSTFCRLESEVTKVEGVSAGGDSSSLSRLLFSIFCFLRHQHNTTSPWKNGMLEEWNIGFKGFNYFRIIPMFQYSTIPLFLFRLLSLLPLWSGRPLP